MKVRLTPEAEADLEGIGDKIAERNAALAVNYFRELQERCLRIAEFPHAGPPRPQWGEAFASLSTASTSSSTASATKPSRFCASCTGRATSMRCLRTNRCRNSALHCCG